MRTIRAIFRDGKLKLLEPIDLPEDTQLTLAVLDSEDLSAEAIAQLACKGGALDFLTDPREDIYSESDGEGI